MTIADLLTHTSGVANPAAESLSGNPTLAEIASAIARQPLQFEPGSEWKYGVGLTAVGRIVEVVSGQSFDRFLKERIFQPLKMNDTTFYPSAEQRQRVATVYRWDRDNQRLAPVAFAANRPLDQERRATNPSGGLTVASLAFAIVGWPSQQARPRENRTVSRGRMVGHRKARWSHPQQLQHQSPILPWPRAARQKQVPPAHSP